MTTVNRRNWLWSGLLLGATALAGVVYANWQQSGSFFCPITGQELPCPNCCPLKEAKVIEDQTYLCPLTDQELPCPNCCPLNQSK